MNDTRKGRRKAMALFAVAIMLAMSIFPMLSAQDSDGELPYYSYTINSNAEVISGTYSPIGSSSDGPYVSSNGENVGSWGFNSDGYGPFNSFYAAFDPAQDNRMICHLDPNDLTRSVDGDSIAGLGYNIMWCLPTVYWSTDSSGNLILSNDPSKGTAFAHTIDGKVYKYIGIGVYEASTKSISGAGTILTSTSGDTPLFSQTRATFRDYANNQSVNTAGTGNNGYAMVWNFYQWELYKYCALAVMGSWDSQSVAGNGSSYGRSPFYDTPGLLNTSGPYAGTRGSVTNTTYTQDPVKVFIENAWGSLYDFVDGIVINGQSGYTIDQSSVPSDSTSTTSSGYITYVGVSLPSSGYGSSPSTNVNVWGMPTANGGSKTSGLYDYIYTSSSSSRVPYVGGYSHQVLSDAPKCGLSFVSAFTALSDVYSYIGGRLAFVFDDDIVTSVNVTFVSNGSALQTQVIDSGTTAVSFNPALDGYTFRGWYTDNTFSTAFDFSTIITSDITLFAKWEGNFAFTSEPTANGTVTRVTSMDGSVIFDASSSEGSLIVWDFGDGTTATGIYQTHYYSQPGTYQVKLLVYNDKGDVDIKEYNVSIPDPSLESLGRGILPTIVIALVLIIGGGLVVRHLL